MAPYSTLADVQLYVPQLVSDEEDPAYIDMDGYIAIADGIMDAHLRALYVVPLTVTNDQILVDISARLAGARVLQAKLGELAGAVPEIASVLETAAMADLERIRENPALLSLNLRTPDGDYLEKDAARVVIHQGPFTSGDETTWRR